MSTRQWSICLLLVCLLSAGTASTLTYFLVSRSKDSHYRAEIQKLEQQRPAAIFARRMGGDQEGWEQVGGRGDRNPFWQGAGRGGNLGPAGGFPGAQNFGGPQRGQIQQNPDGANNRPRRARQQNLQQEYDSLKAKSSRTAEETERMQHLERLIEASRNSQRGGN